MNKRRKILIVSSWYPNRNHPTHGIFHRHFAECISLNNDVFSFHVCSQDNLSRVEISNEDFEKVKTEIVYYPKIYGNSPYHKLQKHLAVKRAFINFIERLESEWGKPDVIVLNVVWPLGKYAILLKNHWNVPMIVTENWTGYHPEDGSYKGFFVKRATQKVIHHADLICPVSLHLQRAMMSHGLNGKFFRIPNVVNTELFQPINSVNENFRLIHVSAFDDQQKNIQGIIEAFASFVKQKPKSELHFVGHGDDFERMKKLANEKIPSQNIVWHGRLLGKELAKQMASCDALVLNSRYENLPLVILEAFACGIPVISTGVGGITEWVNASNGIITDGDQTSLLNAMLQMEINRKQYQKEQLRNYAVANFSYQAIANLFQTAFLKTEHER